MRTAWIPIALLAFASPHDDLHEKLEAADAALETSPERAELWLMRGELHRLHEDYAAAGADLERAEKLDSRLAGLQLARAIALEERPRPQAYLDRAN